MQCPLCRGRVGLLATICACGFDLATNDPAAAKALARRDLRAAARLVGFGLAGAAATVLVAAVTRPRLAWVDWFAPQAGWLPVDPVRSLVGAIAMLLPMSACYGLGRGAWYLASAVRRLVAASRMRRLPRARIVS